MKKRRRSKFAPEEERSLETGAAKEMNRLADPTEAPDEALAGKQVERALDQAIAELGPMYREVLLLRDVEGLTAAEVAEITGVTPPHRARRRPCSRPLRRN
jgi:RNA polymerase sigma-70 factor (ECF subfamily)